MFLSKFPLSKLDISITQSLIEQQDYNLSLLLTLTKYLAKPEVTKTTALLAGVCIWRGVQTY